MAKKTKIHYKINRYSMFFVGLLQVLLMLIFFVLLNYLSCIKHVRIDMSSNQKFTLSERTLQFLAGDSVQKYVGDVRIMAVLKQSSPHYLRIRTQLENYRRGSKNKITLDFVDPVRDSDRLNELTTLYRRSFHQETLLIDARSEEELKKVDVSTHVRSIPVRDLYNEGIDKKNKPFIVSWHDEDVITTYLLSALEGKPRKFYLIADKSDLDQESGKLAAWRVFRRHLLTQNIILEPLKISSVEMIPKDAEGIAIIGPKYDFTEKEIKKIAEYWGRMRASIFVTIQPSAKLRYLKRFLRSYGITPKDNRIITTRYGRTHTNARATFISGSNITKGLDHQSTQFDGSSCGLEVAYNNDRLNIRNINPFSLIVAQENWWGESRYNEENPTFDPREDDGISKSSLNSATPVLCAAVVRGLENDDEKKNLVSKMVVLGNTDFLNAQNTREELTYFVQSSLNWLVGREDLIGIGPRPHFRQKITIDPQKRFWIDRIVLVAFPLFFLIIASITWNLRKL